MFTTALTAHNVHCINCCACRLIAHQFNAAQTIEMGIEPEPSRTNRTRTLEN
jgi:hypothetical protein